MTNEVATKQIIRLATVKLKKFRTTCLWTGAKKQWDFNPKMISIITRDTQMWADIIADKGYVQFSELPGILGV
jgi:hypothetical protein